MKIKVLVTGANGQLAKTIKELFFVNEKGMDFVFASKKELDITKPHQLEAFFNKYNFEYCINCAAYTDVEQAEKTPSIAFKINADGVKHLAEVCKESQTILIHTSTDYVFDGNKETPYTEEDQTNPINEYGKSKLLGEQYIEQTFDNYFIIRTSWLYSKYGKNFLKTIIKKIQQDEHLIITTSQKGTPTSCVDLSMFIYYIIKNRETSFGLYHFTAKGEATWYDFAVQISKYFTKYNASCLSPTKEVVSKVNRPMYSVLNNCKIQWTPFKIEDWRISVDKTVNELIGSQ